MQVHMSTEKITDIVKETYGQAALRATTGGSACCGSGPSTRGGADPITGNLYDEAQKGDLPETAVLASLGCGNPTALAQLSPGETSSISGRAEASTYCFPQASRAGGQGLRSRHDRRDVGAGRREQA